MRTLAQCAIQCIMSREITRQLVATVGRIKWLAWTCAFLALASSAPGEQAVLRSLVGDGTLAPAQVGPFEEIEIRLSHWLPTFGRQLRINLGPDRILTVGRYRISFNDISVSDRRDSGLERSDRVRLSPLAFAEFRRRLAVFRPETLALDSPFLLPTGCDYVFDAADKWSIAFAAPDNRFGVFIRQGKGECNSASADRLDDALREILATLPRTEAATGFNW